MKNTPTEPGKEGDCGCEEMISRRSFFKRLSIFLSGVIAAVLAVPILGFVLEPVFRPKSPVWRSVGPVDSFKVGETVAVSFQQPSPLPWAGAIGNAAAWLRRESDTEFIAFQVNCMHLGCPVRWMPDADLFMCPCHGGVYYSDGRVAAGPPPRPLARYATRIQDGQVQLQTHPIVIA